jgi:hypothetical protein
MKYLIFLYYHYDIVDHKNYTLKEYIPGVTALSKSIQVPQVLVRAPFYRFYLSCIRQGWEQGSVTLSNLK